MNASKGCWEQVWRALFAIVMVLCASCAPIGPSERAASGGTGSEIVGTAVYDSTAMGKCLAVKAFNAGAIFPVISGNVFCYQREYVPDTNWVTSGPLPRVRTDSAGIFHIKDAPSGEVVVEANDGKGNSVVHTVTVDKDSAIYPIGVLTVKKTGAITIQAKTQLPGRVRFYVSVKGTRLVVRGSQTNVDIKLDNIPCGIQHTVSVRVYEPIYLALDIPNISVSSAATKALEAFQIK
jgi:hypothetical protein